MLRYKTETSPGLVALYDIRPGNGAGQFLQPRSPHGASTVTIAMEKTLTDTRTLRTGCSKADPKIFTRHRPPSQGRRMAKI